MDWMIEILNDKQELLNDLLEKGYLELVEQVGKELVLAIRNGKRIFLAGNGGSAADAQHFAGEIVGRFTMEREALPAISLCTDPSVVSCIANDYGYEEVFARQILGLGEPQDIFIAISTSGNSANLIKAIDAAKEKKMMTVGLLGKDGGSMKTLCDRTLVVPSFITPRIQEIHTLTVHLLCELIERELFL